MDLTVGPSSLRVFGKAVQALAKIGDEVFFEASATQLTVRTVNTAKSAFATFVFNESFFIKYACAMPATEETGEIDLQWKIPVRSALFAFKSLIALERTAETCDMCISEQECRLIIRLYCKFGVTKTFSFPYSDAEKIEAAFDKATTRNSLVCSTKVFSDVLEKFKTGEEEITMLGKKEGLTIRNYAHEVITSTTFVRTKFSLLKSEFQRYTVEVETDVTFCVKELRAFLSFADPLATDMVTYFENGGKPVIFSLEDDNGTFQTDFVIATVPKDDFIPNPAQADEEELNASQALRLNHSVDVGSPSTPMTSTKRPMNSTNRGRAMPQQPPARAKVRRNVTGADSIIAEKPHSNGDLQTSSSASAVAQGNRNGTTAEEEEIDDSVPGTPPDIKRFRSKFFGLSQSTFYASQMQATVLVEDSDQEGSIESGTDDD